MRINQWPAKTFTLFLLMIVSSFLLISCAEKEQRKAKVSPGKKQALSTTSQSVGSKWRLPVSIPEGEFNKIGGWLSEHELLYIVNQGQTSSVYQYDLLTGKSKLTYKSEAPIVTVSISPSRQYILIHSSPSTYEGTITVINKKGLRLANKSITSFELSFEWNPYHESEVLITQFNQDWSFKVFLFNIKNSETKLLSLPQPFLKWMDANTAAYLNWNMDHPELTAPLLASNINGGTDKVLFKNAIQFSTFKNLIMVVSVNEQHPSEGIYTLYNQDLQKRLSFNMPLLSRYSDWLVPFFDYSDKVKKFFTLRAKTAGEADTYTSGFDLVSCDIKGKEQRIINGLENSPISLSPSGAAMLYGNQFENIIDIDNKKVYPVIKLSK